MTQREKFVAVMTRRGYKVSEMGKMVILTMDNYTAVHFFNADGSRDENQKPYWKVDRPSADLKNT